MNTDRPQLYFFLLPFTIASIFIYTQILIEVYRKRGYVMYDSFFFRMICSQSLYDISFVIMYFVMELPQDWPELLSFYLVMNGTIIPHLIYAHGFMCAVAQILGVAMMAVSRMLLVCHPTHATTKFLRRLTTKQVALIHCIIPASYACYVLVAHGWRSYAVSGGRISRVGSQESITINSQVLCALGLSCSLLSAVCYVRIFMTLRKRPLRTWRSELYILATSFVLFCALCTISAFFVANVIVRSVPGLFPIYYTLRKHSYAFTFLLSLANPWCLMISSASMRSSVLRRCLPSCCTQLPLFASLFSQQTAVLSTSILSATKSVVCEPGLLIDT